MSAVVSLWRSLDGVHEIQTKVCLRISEVAVENKLKYCFRFESELSVYMKGTYCPCIACAHFPR